ncbi:MAG: RNase adapter RapZ [Alphaproteobacteria bacterium]|nr:RNase adapter RapZ [Alphaproteobacteria bacterium]
MTGDAPASDGTGTTGGGSLVDRVILVTGMSGAGRTAALKVLEDLGSEAVDNLPLRLMATLVGQGPAAGRGLAVGIDIRTRDFDANAFAETVAKLRAQASVPIDILFLDCNSDVLQRRYTETRRVHPMASDRPLSDGIVAERALLAPLREAADIVIDTSHTNIHEFARILHSQLADAAAAAPHVQVVSFAYRNGVPRDADLVFDARFLRNPHYDPDLRPLTGNDRAVGAYIEGDADFAAFFSHLTELLELLLPRFQQEGKSYLTIAIGCTGGRHRSVYIAGKLGAWLNERAALVDVRHRELQDMAP